MSLSGSLRGIGLVFGLSLCLMVVGCGAGTIPLAGGAAGGGSSSTGSGNTTTGGGTSTNGGGTSGTGSGTSGGGTSGTGGGTSGGGTSAGGGGASSGGGSSGSGGGTSGGGTSGGGGGTPVPGASLSGRVNGGQKAIAGSNVYLYAAGTGGYGTGATSLLGGSGYVTTDATGVFGLGAYTCPTANSQLYLVATGGNTGAGENNQAVLMVALGSCGSIGPSSFININEVSSVASVYALAQFMTPGSTAVGTSSTNVQGLVNAFNTVANLVDVTSGSARTTTPAGNGTVPAATINTLANIMEACVNTSGGGGACSSLFTAATLPGGAAPADTLSAMIDIAQNPGNNVQGLYKVISSKGDFQPSLVGAPNDWTLSVQYSGGLNGPQLPAVDAAGNIWVPNAGSSTLSEFSPVGELLSPASGFTGGGLSIPEAVAIDLAGNIWTANTGNNTVSKHTSGGSPVSGAGYTATGLNYPYAIALDSAGNVFTANGVNTVTKLNGSGTQVANFTGGGLDIPYSVAIDTSQNVWVADSGISNMVSKFSNGGTAASTTGFSGGGLAGPSWVAIDGTGNAWVANFNTSSVSKLDPTGTPLSGAGFVTPNNVSTLAIDGNNTVWTANGDGSISHLSNGGAAISPATGYMSSQATAEVGVVIDASGNVWTTDNFVDSLFEYVGAASPTVVPLQAAVKNNMIGKRP